MVLTFNHRLRSEVVLILLIDLSEYFLHSCVELSSSLIKHNFTTNDDTVNGPLSRIGWEKLVLGFNYHPCRVLEMK